MSRFDYIKYDDRAQIAQETAKTQVTKLERIINEDLGHIAGDLEKKFAIQKLEECYMWIGKAIRNDQIARNGSAPLQEERTNS